MTDLHNIVSGRHNLARLFRDAGQAAILAELSEGAGYHLAQTALSEVRAGLATAEAALLRAQTLEAEQSATYEALALRVRELQAARAMIPETETRARMIASDNIHSAEGPRNEAAAILDDRRHNTARRERELADLRQTVAIIEGLRRPAMPTVRAILSGD